MITTTLLAASLRAAAPADAIDRCRNSLCSPGDLDGDGVSDVVVAGRLAAEVFGWGGCSVPTVRALSGVDGSPLWTAEGQPGFGLEVAAAGDLDGDGIGDVAVASPRASEVWRVTSGPLVLLSGGSGARLATVQSPRGIAAFGTSISAGLQLVGDPTPDVLVGADRCVVLVDGGLRRPVSLWYRTEAAVVSAGFEVDESGALVAPAEARSQFGRSSSNLEVAGFGIADLDGDGRGEVLIPRFSGIWPAPSTQPLPEFTEPLALRRGLPLRDGWAATWLVDASGVPDAVVTTTIDESISATDLETGEERWSHDYSGGYLQAEGATIARVGDFDGDGLADLAHTANETGMDCDGGFLVIHSAADGSVLRQLDVVGLDDSLLPIEGDWCRSGYDVTALDDSDGDGFPELALHAPRYRQVRLLDGRTLEPRWNVNLGR
ncbi:hypothetical protein [Engelhardtia mirabilis]|uniref:FG-GAP repeat protein n=1 Tax=Engelhardtia mirabilis TaxID=2528011 RepID=A0A518BLU1_9BACT|nr:FG-GAP repeat protein [Planctomycetes bacterium Pla133]QDV02275.1 FG-GAP repeat protein [Planctomycetes bacterium Pla86]